MDTLILYHASSRIISMPVPEGSSDINDFGSGFYLAQSKEAAFQWAVSRGESGFVNKYELNTENLNILDLYSNEYGILNWLCVVLENRSFRISDPAVARACEYIRKNFYTDISGYDAVRGCRADEIYFFFIKAFLSSTLSLGQFKRLMDLGPVGEQIVLKSEEAFSALRFVSFEGSDAAFAYPRKKTRNDNALASFYAETDLGDEGGIYMRDILREEIKADDERLG